VAAKLRTDLREDVTLVEGSPSEFTVLVNGAAVMTRGWWILLGMVPPYGRVLAAVRASLARGPVA
jgi:hypothetical protein